MKLSEVVLRDRIPAMGTSSFKPPAFDVSFESGIVTIKRAERSEEPEWLVPIHNVVYMRYLPEPEATKKK